VKLERLDGKTWEELVEFMETNRHALALEGDPELECAIIADEYDPEAGAAAAVAYRFLQANGAAKTMYKAIEMYESLSGDPSFLLKELRMSVAWVSRPYLRTAKFPIKPYNGEDEQKHGGLANVMLAVAAKELSKGSNTEILAAIAINKFFDEGMAAKSAKTESHCGMG
jgi:hypothetical protein